MYDDELK